jgi:hypothetical protein
MLPAIICSYCCLFIGGANLWLRGVAWHEGLGRLPRALFGTQAHSG